MGIKDGKMTSKRGEVPTSVKVKRDHMEEARENVSFKLLIFVSLTFM